jgi:predicted O-linked N-acetylglucosamine transferase (SPINDLY family)
MDTDAGIAEQDVVSLNEEATRLATAGWHAEALELFRHAAAVPGAIGARLNLGYCQIRLGDPRGAEQEARAILAERSSYVPAYRLLAEALEAAGEADAALAALEAASGVAPAHGPVWSALGDLHQRAQRYEQARDAYERAVQMDPADARGLAALVALKRALCEWSDLDRLSGRLRDVVRQGRGVVQPLAFLGEPTTAAEQRACAEAWVGPRVRAGNQLAAASRRLGQPRLGFVSYGFGAHPTGILMPALLEALAARGVDLHLFCTGPDDGSRYRRRFASAAPLHQVEHMSPADIAGKVRALGIDVLIDLDGYSREQLPTVFVERPAPMQIVWLGFPGTTGATCFDYVLADRFVLPESVAAEFTERVAYLPRCYQPNDPTRVVAEPPSREAFGLPSHDMVYACFNAPQKLNPRSFSRMVRVLREVPDSVLWLLQGPGKASERIRERAATLGIAPDRIVFLAKRGHDAYLAAYRHADLFLDTEYYNAHTTASDAMWAGCPVLTRPGETFASRVAGSLNHHAGLDELNAADDGDFVRRAVRFARDDAWRKGIRHGLASARQGGPLFDMMAFAEELMHVIGTLWQESPDPLIRP